MDKRLYGILLTQMILAAPLVANDESLDEEIIKDLEIIENLELLESMNEESDDFEEEIPPVFENDSGEDKGDGLSPRTLRRGRLPYGDFPGTGQKE